MKELTYKQKEVLKFIWNYLKNHSHPPTIREIGDGLKFSSTGTVRDYLTALKRKGFIKIQQNKSRAIEIIKRSLFHIPIAGSIHAGPADLAIEDIQGYLELDDFMLKDDMFALRIKGDSMTDSGIMEGDLVVVKRQETALTNDIIVALLNSNEATVKILRKKDNIFFLEPANKKYESIYQDFNIIGKVVSVIRRYR